MRNNKKNNNIIKIAVFGFLLIAVALIISKGHLFSISSPFIPIPSSVVPYVTFNGTSLPQNGNGFIYQNEVGITQYVYGGVNGTNEYQITLYQPFSQSNGFESMMGSNEYWLYIANGYQGKWGYAADSDLSQLPSINSTLANAQSNYQSNGCNTSYQGACYSWTAQISVDEAMQQIFLNAINYNNNLTPPTTTSTTSISTSTTTTIIPLPPPPPANNWFSSFINGIINFFKVLFS